MTVNCKEPFCNTGYIRPYFYDTVCVLPYTNVMPDDFVAYNCSVPLTNRQCNTVITRHNGRLYKVYKGFLCNFPVGGHNNRRVEINN